MSRGAEQGSQSLPPPAAGAQAPEGAAAEGALWRSPARLAEAAYAGYRAARLRGLVAYFTDETVPRVVRRQVWRGLRRRLSPELETALRAGIGALIRARRRAQAEKNFQRERMEDGP